jgi:hypothetical protein
MMPQNEAGKPATGQTDSTYGRYEENQSFSAQQFDPPYQQAALGGSADKVYAPVSDTKNLYRLITFGMSMLTLIISVVICLLFVGGTAGWISFCAASITILSVAAVTIDKIK